MHSYLFWQKSMNYKRNEKSYTRIQADETSYSKGVKPWQVTESSMVLSLRGQWSQGWSVGVKNGRAPRI